MRVRLNPEPFERELRRVEREMREALPPRPRRDVMWVEPDEDDEVTFVEDDGMLSPSVRRYERARKAVQACNASELATTTDPAVIAQQLWQESRKLLAKVGVELPAAPPAPVEPVRWYRRPAVRRLGFFGAVPALVFLALFYALSGEILLGGPLVAFLWGAFVTYEMTAWTDARGVTVRSKVRPSQLAARIVAIIAIGALIGWLT